MNIIEINNYLRDNDTRDIERCGLFLTNTKEVIEGVNIHPHPTNNFLLDKKTTLKLNRVRKSGKEVVVWHTHIGNGLTGFSPKDMEEIYKSDVPWYMVHMDKGITDYCHPNKIEPLEGREWRWASQNCYTLVRDFYKLEMGITLGNFFNEHPTCWEDDGWNEYLENIEKQGFRRITDDSEKYGDIILMKIGRAYSANHGAIRLHPNTNTILHHILEKVSGIDVLDNNWKRRIDSCWRYYGN
jgi:proteasome lid subunit RPN8/RPN11